MKSGLTMAFLLLSSYTIQTSFFPQLFFVLSRIPGFGFLAGHSLNLVALWLIYLSLNRDVSGTLIWAIVAGVVGNWFGVAWNGAFASGLFVTALVCSALKTHVFLKDAGSTALFASGLFLVEGITHLGMGHILQQIQTPLRYQFWTLLVYTALNSAVSPVVFMLLKQIDLWTGGISPRNRRSLYYEI